MSKIIITVGHGTAKDGKTYDSGAVSKDKKYQEFKIAKEIAKYAQKYYNANFKEHCDLMNYDGDLSLPERISKLKDDTYSFIAEIHLNSGGGTGTECFHAVNDEKGEQYAEEITKSIASTFDIVNRGAKTKTDDNGKDYFGIIRSTKPCAVLVETVFIDSDADLAKVKTAAGQKKCGEAIAKAIGAIRNKAPKKESKKETAKAFKPYTVRIVATNLNVRAGAGTQYAVRTTVHKNEVYTIVDKKDGWLKLKSGAGYIAEKYTKKI